MQMVETTVVLSQHFLRSTLLHMSMCVYGQGSRDVYVVQATLLLWPLSTLYEEFIG